MGRAEAALNHVGTLQPSPLRARIDDALSVRRYGRAAALVARAALSPRLLRLWLADMSAIARLAGVEVLPAGLVLKPWGRFIHTRLPPADRIAIAVGHYHTMIERLGPGFVADVVTDPGIVIGQVSGRAADPYTVVLAAKPHHGTEGELTLMIWRRQEGQIASLSFTIGPSRAGPGPDLWIGGLQGAKAPDSKRMMISVTRDLWGLRPKDLLVHAVQDLAAAFAVERIKAVSNAAQVVRPSRRRATRRADYDAYWLERGGVAVDPACFELPLLRSPRSAADMSAKKRAAWRARHVLLDRFSAQIRARLDNYAGSLAA
jgi:uncharacterized protein VirK/YbjX